MKLSPTNAPRTPPHARVGSWSARGDRRRPPRPPRADAGDRDRDEGAAQADHGEQGRERGAGEVGLGDEAARAAALHQRAEVRAVAAGDEHDRRASRSAVSRGGDLEAVDVGQADVEQDDVGPQRSARVERRWRRPAASPTTS